MALGSVVYKAALQVADMDRHYYGDHALVVARHPSETDERMMVRILAFAWYADEALAFGRGLSDGDEPDLWRRDLTGAISLWVEVGLPDEKWLRKASARADKVVLFAYGRGVEMWWERCRRDVARLSNLEIVVVPADVSRALGELARRTMRLQCTIQDGEAWLGDGDAIVRVQPERLFPPPR